ncbi:acyltransferase family protein [Prolixibacteraceae bacterium]|nr:acyltransferase family protein [Prolixibacteraceae bacterium]
MNYRESNFDLLRVIACTMVISSHVTSPYMEGSIPGEINFLVSNSIQSFCRVCIAIFVMIGGRYVLDKKENIDYQTFYSNTLLKRIVYPTLIWSAFYVIYCYMQGGVCVFLKIRPFDYSLPLKNWFLGRPFNHLWYMYMLIGLYACVPALMMIKQHVGEQTFLHLGVILLLLSPIIDYYSELFWMIRFVEFLGYFILGYSLKGKRVASISKWMFLLAWFICSLMITFLTSRLYSRDSSNAFYFYGFFTPFAMIGALSLYNFFDQLKLSTYTSLFESLSFHSFRVYLVHAGILSIIENVVFDFLKWHVTPLIYIPITIVMVSIGSYIFSVFIENLKSRFEFLKYI